MTFFEQQRKARSRTVFLLFLYFLANISIIVAVYLTLIFTRFFYDLDLDQNSKLEYWQPEVFSAVSLCLGFIVLLGTSIKLIQLAKGGISIAHSLGGRIIYPDTQNVSEQRIINVVEEIAIASGVQIPQVYLMEREAGINAFAAGYKTNSAVIGISQGCLDYLSRDELQGVIAHEFSHILNGDMKLNIRLIAILNGIILLTVIGRGLIRTTYHTSTSNRNKSSANFLPLIGIVLVVIGGLGVIFARLIKMAVSRQREFLADASAVQFTRNPSGIGGALIKIGGLSQGSILRSSHAEEVSHLCFSNAVRGIFSSAALFSTHPPLKIRIKKILPSFDGHYPSVSRLVQEDQIKKVSTDSSIMSDPIGTGPITMHFLNSVGQLNPDNMAESKKVISDFSEALVSGCRNPMDSSAIVCCLLISNEKELEQRQKEQIKLQLPEIVFNLLDYYKLQVQSIARDKQLPLLDLALGSLKGLSKHQYLQLRLALDSLIHSDNKVSIFEYSLYTVATNNLDIFFGLESGKKKELKELNKIVVPVSKLLFALAHLSNEDITVAQSAYLQACEYLGIASSLRLEKETRKDISVVFLDEAAKSLRIVHPDIQEKILKACIECVTADNILNDNEYELLRAIGDTLGCPIPLRSTLSV